MTSRTTSSRSPWRLASETISRWMLSRSLGEVTAPESRRCWSRPARWRTWSTSCSALICSRAVSLSSVVEATRRSRCWARSFVSDSISACSGRELRLWSSCDSRTSRAWTSRSRIWSAGAAFSWGLLRGRREWWDDQGSVTVVETWTRRSQPWRSEIASSWAAACSHQGHSVAQCAASTSPSGEDWVASETGWWRRSAVRNASTPAALTSSKRPSPEPPLTATVRTRASGSPAIRTPCAVAGSRCATRAAKSRSVAGWSSSQTRPRPRRPAGSVGSGTRGRTIRRSSAPARASETPGSAVSALVCATCSAMSFLIRVCTTRPLKVEAATVVVPRR